GRFEHGRIERSYAAGKIEGRMYIGGLVGYSYMLDGQESSITDSFAIGEIKARGASRNYYAGGLVGYIYGISQNVFHIQNCYAAVDLSGTAADKGGLVARGDRVLEVTSSFYDGTVNADVSSDLYNIPKTSEELKTIATFEGWDIAEGVDNMKIWSIRSGQCYPWLNKIGQPDSEDFPEVVLATGVVLHKDVITLTIGLDETTASETLIAVVQPPDAYNKAVTWHSNHPEIAAVDQTGTVTGLSEGTAIITVNTKDGDHADTCRVVVRRAAVPAEVPDNIRLKAASTSIMIQWDEVDGATGYEIRADDALQSVTEAVYIHEGLKPNTTYRYQVRAVNAYGAGEWSRIVEKSTLSQGAPAIPTNIRGTSTDTSITIQWDPAADATGYELETDTVLRSVTDTVYRHTGLEPATWHRYRVRAVNDKGKSEWSDVFRKSTLFQGIPETPANIRAAVTSTGILLEWDEVLGASGYVVEADGAPQSVAEAVYHHTGLEPGTWHRYRIKAVNAYGAGEWSQVFKQATLSTEELNAPAGIEAAATRTSITLTWEDVPGASGYEVEVYGTVIDNGTSTQYTHEGLNANTQYVYRIRAKNAKGVGPWSGIVAKTTLTGIPANISTEADDASITVSWDNVSGAAAYDVEIDGGQIVECIAPFYIHRVVNPNMRHTYRVRSKNAEGVSDWSQPVSNITLLPVPQNIKGIVEDTNIVLSWEEVEQAAGYDVEVDGTIIDNGAGTSYIHKGLAANSTHIYRVRAKNTDTLGMWSEEIIKVVRPVSDISLTAEATDTEIRVMWNTVSGATGYDIEVDGKIIDNGLSTIYVHQGLEPNTAHTYRVRARNAGGAGEWSELITQITSAGKPGNVLVTATSTSIRLVWEEVYGAVRYDILAGSEIIDHGMNTAYEHTGLEPNTLHIYRIRVRTEAGEGMWSEPITQFTMVGAPSNIFVEAQSTQIALKWDAVDGATGYEIEADGAVLELGTATAYVHEGLTPNTLHTYRVRAKNENGIGDWSELIRQIAAPSIHLNLRATAATDSITVMWDAVEGAVAYDIEADGHIVEDIKETSYVHQGLTPNTRHMYRVRVKNEGATSEWSERLEHNTMPELNIDVGKDNEFNFVVVVPEKEGTTTRRIVVYYNPEQLEVVDLCAITPEIEDQAGAIEGTDMRIDSFVPGEIAYVVQNADKVVVNSIKFRVKTNGHSKVRYVIE
ncbi:MAG: fibronectin type III domain-containing protein, partial [Firmicutes bacterium]|nr:fibronectin type III domain-containing protein [Bacillota bacterium]